MNLFIDTNVFLSFYHLSSDDLEELRKLVVLIDQDKVKLLLPVQVIDEFRRNRDSKITDAIRRFTEEKLNRQFPQICKEYEEYRVMQEAITRYLEAQSIIVEKLYQDFQNQTFVADTIINDLFGKADKIEVTDEIFTKAKRRQELGNPPGKDGLGDAINWECLLETVSNEEDLFFISDDKDYHALSNKDLFLPYLNTEWIERKDSSIVFFKRLSDFFKNQFPEIKLARELEKGILINDLIQSTSFARTRRTLRKLVQFSDYTESEINEIVSAAISNNQIYWIMQDEDINSYLRTIVEGRERLIEPKNLKLFYKLLDGNDSDDNADDEIPF
jgi:predicted nucleic acid-binding protein